MGDCANSDLIYIMNPGCGWCKKSDPVVEEYKESGICITTLDVSNAEDGAKAKELMETHKIRCGTPLFLNQKTGENVCGFRGKDILDKWVNGEPIPAPKLATNGAGMPPQRPQNQQNQQDPRMMQQQMMAQQQQSMQQMALENQKMRYDMYKHVENRMKNKKPTHEDIMNGVEEIFSFVRKQG